MSIFRWNMKKRNMSEDEMLDIAIAVKNALENLGYKVEFKITPKGLSVSLYKKQ